MENKFLIILTCAFNPSQAHTTAFGEERIKQYIEGLSKVKELAEKYSQFDLALADNTILEDWQMPKELKKIVESLPRLKQYYFFDNNLPSQNKGCGNIISWKKVLENTDMTKYSFVVHFEPRCLLSDFSFFDRLVLKPGSYFRVLTYRIKAKTKAKIIQWILKILPIYGKEFWTGLFSLDSQTFINLINKIDLPKMAESKVSLEKILYQKLSKNDYLTVYSLGVIWHNAYSGKDDLY